MKKIKTFRTLSLFILAGFLVACSNNMQNFYVATASVSSFPTGTVIDEDANGKADGMDIDGDGVIDMRYVEPIGIPAIGIDINNDGVADFYMYTTSSGSVLNTQEDGQGETVTTVISNGTLIGYDLDGDGVVNINVTGTSTFFTVGGNATGLSSSVILALTINNSSFEYLTITSDGTYTFTSQVNENYYYAVSIASSSQDCTLTNASGLMGATDVTNVNLVCGNLTVGGTITPALTGSMILSMTINNSTTEFLTVNSGATSFTFSSKLRTGSFYEVLIISSVDTCGIASNTGTMASSSVSTIPITCSQYTVGGTITPGLTASMILSLSVNGAVVENLTKASGQIAFTFAKKLFDGDVYSVQIVSTTQNCTISSNIGTINTASVGGVAVNCGAYSARVQILEPSGGLNSPSINLTLSVNGVLKETKSILALSLTGAGTYYTFNSLMLNGDIYSIQITSSSVNCSITGGAGTINTGNVTADISCAQYTLGNYVVGTYLGVPGLTGSVTVSLSVNGSFVETKTLTNDAANDLLTSPYAASATTEDLLFNEVLKGGDSYSVQIVTTSGDRCQISDNTGVIGASNITNVMIECAQYTVGNTILPIVGFSGVDNVVLSLSINGTFVESISVTNPTTSFTFIEKLYDQDAYNVQLLSSSKSCVISSNTGTISAANKTNVEVTCAQYTVGGGAITNLGSSDLTISLTINGANPSYRTITGPSPVSIPTFTELLLYENDYYDLQIISATENCQVLNGSDIVPPGGVAIQPTIDCGKWQVGITRLNPNGAGCTLNSLSVNLELLNGTLPLGTKTVSGFSGTTSLFATPLFIVNDFYQLTIANYNVTGCGGRCGFNNGMSFDPTVLTTTAQFTSGTNVNIPVYCW
jgi:hypothetical protein